MLATQATLSHGASPLDRQVWSVGAAGGRAAGALV